MDPVCHICKTKYSATYSIMWSLSQFQISPRVSLIGTRMSPYAVISCTSTVLDSSTRHIIFATGSMIKNRKVKNIENGIKQVNNMYLQCGFNITRIHSDSEFESLRSIIDDLGITLNFLSKEEHVPNI